MFLENRRLEEELLFSLAAFLHLKKKILGAEEAPPEQPALLSSPPARDQPQPAASVLRAG